MKKYWILINNEQKGPFSIDELVSLNIKPSDSIWYEGMNDWSIFGSTDDYQLFLERKKEIVSIPIVKKKKLLKVSIFTGISVIILVTSFFLYQRFYLNEGMVKETANKLFTILTMKNADIKSIEDIYPEFRKIENHAIFNNICKITSISKNSNNEFEVYANYGKKIENSSTVLLLIGKVDGKVIVKKSKGIHYSYYDQVFEYGKKKGCLTGQEYDTEIEKVIKAKKLRDEIEALTALAISLLDKNIKLTSNASINYGYITGNVTVFNNNFIDFFTSEVDCWIEFYDAENNLVESDKIYLFEGLKSQGSVNGRISSGNSNASRYIVKTRVNVNEDMKLRIKNDFINSTTPGCI